MVIFRETIANWFKIIWNFHIEIKGQFVDCLSLFAREIAHEIAFMNKAQMVDIHLDTRFFKNFAHNGFFSRLPELDTATNRIEVINLVISCH